MVKDGSMCETICESETVFLLTTGKDYLICHGNVDAKQKPKPVIRGQLVKLVRGKRRVLVADVGQFGDAKHESVAVDLDEIVSGDGRGVHMMFSERPDEVLPDERVDGAPGVGSPVDETRSKIRHEDAQNGGSNHGRQIRYVESQNQQS